MSYSKAIQAAGLGLFLVAGLGSLFALLIAAISAFFLYVHLTVDDFGAGPLVWILNPAVWLTPILFGGSAVIAFRVARQPHPKSLAFALGLSFLAAAILLIYLRFDPLLEVDSCFDAGGVWRNEACIR